MTDAVRKLNVMFGFPSYAGNSGGTSEVADVRKWYAKTLLEMRNDPRIGEVFEETIADTPITAVRNQFVLKARAAGAHLLIMIDSDHNPLKHEREPWYKPFWKEAFDTIYRHYDRGPLVVGAPYCGPPSESALAENVYVFYWDNGGVKGDETAFRLEMYPRAQAAQMSGVQECAALPTGLIMCDMRIFELLEPSHKTKRQVLNELAEGKLSVRDAELELTDGWFYYEWKNGYAAEKASTEDVTFTRDVSLVGINKLGYNPLYCTWDSWIGHWKPMCVGKPFYYGVEQVGATFKRALEANLSSHDKRIYLEPSDKMKALFGIP